MMIEQIQNIFQIKINYFRQFQSNRIGNLFQETNGFVYINDIFTFLLLVH
jgi:hypothetical protein